MSQIYEILCAIGDFFVSIYDLVVNIVTGAWDMIKLIPSGQKVFVDALAAIPPIVHPYAMATITIAVLYIIIGRGGSD